MCVCDSVCPPVCLRYAVGDVKVQPLPANDKFEFLLCKNCAILNADYFSTLCIGLAYRLCLLGYDDDDDDDD